MVGILIRGILALVALAVFVAIWLSEDNPVYLFLGVIVAALFWNLGRRRRSSRGRHVGGAASGWDGDDNDNGGGWFDWGDGGGNGGDGGGGDGGGGGD